MRTLLCLASSLVLVVSACGDNGGQSHDAAPADASADAPPPPIDAALAAPAFRNVVTLPDDVLALEALKLLGSEDLGSTERCNGCHTMISPRLRKWEALGVESLSTCLTDLTVATPEIAKTMVDCLRADPTDPTTPFQTPKLGPWSGAAHLEWFKYTFQKAYPTTWETELAAFTDRVGMPQGSSHAAFTQAEFDIVAEWFMRGLPLIDVLLHDEPAPDGCVPTISVDVGDHVAAMKTTGWGAVNKENGILMHGCAGATDPKGCLAEYPRAGASPFSIGWEDALPGAKLRVLRTNNYRSSYWTRSSADGRFVGHGASSGGMNAAFVDLQSDAVIPANAFYDPGFFPDNSGFIFQANDAHLCGQGVLTASPTSVTFNEPGCSSATNIGLYQHVSAALGGGDYWAVAGSFVSDDGGKEATFQEPDCDFNSMARIRLTPMVHDGTQYVAGTRVSVTTPFEGDTIISPSSELVLSRVAGPNGKQKGFELRKVVATPDGMGGYTVALPSIATYCMAGGKPSFSFDERYMVMHHYVDDSAAVNLGFSGPDDPGFAAYKSAGAANLFLVDVVTGARTRITNMKPGQYAFSPHFRSDGWIYFMVRSSSTATEYIVASDAALVLGAAL